MSVFETIEVAAESMGLDEWLCHYPTEVWGEEEPRGWDAPMTDKEFDGLIETAEEEDW